MMLRTASFYHKLLQQKQRLIAAFVLYYNGT